ncbi:DinB family protein [Marininema halotolerans]|uniref:DinB superfamily protein n=1 Tax=Marininema halotolerans TaxID=1155944 RepID=A0A1I6RJI3_9BACL|nr:DinB family protein [Marininema halotolerans]SFS64899.1 DinB superfamily protein [Marininema halotolerans]
MRPIDLMVFHLEEVRRRSIKTWLGVPEGHDHWRPDKEAFSFIEMVRGIWKRDTQYLQLLRSKGEDIPDESLSEPSLTTIPQEIEFSFAQRLKLLNGVKSLQPLDLDNQRITRTTGESQPLSEFLLLIAHHEAVHTGYFMQYLRMFQADRPNIWD